MSLFSNGNARVVSRLPARVISIVAFAGFALSCDAQDRSTPLPRGGSAKEVAIAGAVVMIGAGDIAQCNNNGDELTAVLVDSLLKADSAAGVENVVFTMGDNAYPSGAQGSRDTFGRCFQPSWGTKRIMDVIRPSPGNHDFENVLGKGYYGYFGDKAGPPNKGWYSYDIGKWHIISLNSEILFRREFQSLINEQQNWLRDDLKKNSKKCTMAYWHRPLFSSGWHGESDQTQSFWNILYENGADLVVNGHEHDYERFLPQTPIGVPDSVRGIEEIVAGTGGAELRAFRSRLAPNSEVQIAGHNGVLKLTLGDEEYRHVFIDVQGRLWDEGGRKCH
ncbi:MAG TPA: metallophosphoesterase [Gemmatimonadaceae bacterium]|nr:metallophosphoesterase [Gemmatimonadaceae bacterium]